MLLRDHNLNLLPILRELLRSRSVSRTAEQVGLSQSAVSAALSRLRETFEDDLLVRVGRRLELTEKALLLVEQTERAYIEVEALLRPPAFDPENERRRFVVATADYVPFLMAPGLARLFADHAPNASVHFIDIPEGFEAEIVRGAVDAIIVPDDTIGEFGETAQSMALFEDEMVVIASRAKRRFSGDLTREVYEASRHAMFQMSPRVETTHQTLGMRARDVRQKNVVVVQQFSALPAIVEATACLAVVQRRIAERFSDAYAIDIFPPPFAMAPLKFRAFWGRSVARDPAHIWLRSMLQQAVPLPT